METETRKRRRRTWSSFGEVRRLPSEYEIVTHQLNYTTRTGRSAALEQNSSSPQNLWFLTYRDRSPLRSEDWNGFRDPDQLTYRKYVTLQDDQETAAQAILDDYSQAGHDSGLSPSWVAALATLLTPIRYPAHAVQLCHAYLGQMAPASYISNCAAFSAADMLRQVSLIAYRTRELQRAHPDAGFGTGERRIWETHADWQGSRRALEQALVAYDWGECFVAVNLVLRPTLDAILLRQLGEVARANGDDLTWLLLANLDEDAERCRRWSAALARHALEQRPENADVLRRWVERWTPRAEVASEGLARLLETLPDQGRPVAETVAAARRLRENLHAEVGMLVDR